MYELLPRFEYKSVMGQSQKKSFINTLFQRV